MVKRSSAPWTVTDGRAGNVRQAVALASALRQGTHRPLLLQPRAPWRWLAPRRLPGDVNGYGEAFATLAKLQEQGLVRHLGVSNVSPAQLAEARTIAPVVCVQNHYNLVHRADDPLVDALARLVERGPRWDYAVVDGRWAPTPDPRDLDPFGVGGVVPTPSCGSR